MKKYVLLVLALLLALSFTACGEGGNGEIIPPGTNGDSMQSQTNGIRNLIVKEFLSQIVVKPPYLKQLEIVDYINNIRTRAKALQAEGKAILEDAKRKVEQIIIGG